MIRRPHLLAGRRIRFANRPAIGTTDDAANAATALSAVASALAMSLERLARDVEEAIAAHQRAVADVRLRLEMLSDRRVSHEAERSTAAESHVGEERRADLVARLFGPFEVSLAGVPVRSWRSQKAASLLKYILLHDNCPARCETLMNVFWPSSSPKAARNNLNVVIYQLRSTLKTSDPTRTHIVHIDSAYQLDPELTWSSDVHEFSEAMRLGRHAADIGDVEAALASYQHAHKLYRGVLLEGDSSGDWYVDAQHRLQQKHCELLDSLGNLLLAHGDPPEAAAVGEELLVADPCRETGHQLLMRAYAALEQPQLVVRQYQRCAEMLRRELSVNPAPATIALYNRLVSKR